MAYKTVFNKFLLLTLMFLLFILFSCKNKTEQDVSKKESDQSTQSAQDYNESNEDLLTVDYKEFYDELAPHGKWVQVNASDLGIDMKQTSWLKNENRIFSRLLGIEDAYAYADIGMFFAWQPSPDLTVSVTAGEPAPVYVPYSNGQWVNTDAGWYFKAPTPYEETVHHYGRWVYDPVLGYVWVPGNVWAPAWVDWRESDDYVSWAPIPPSVYFVNNIITVPVIEEDRYVVVEKKYFVEPDMYKYKYMYKENKNKIMIKEMVKRDGPMIVNKTIINKGPEPEGIEKVTGKKLEKIKIKNVENKGDVRYAAGEYDVYTPKLKKVEYSKDMKTPVSQPKEFSKSEDVKTMMKESKEKGGERNEEKVMDKNKEEKGVEKSREKTGHEKEFKEDKGNKEKDKTEKQYKEDKGDKEKGNKEDKGIKENKDYQEKEHKDKGDQDKQQKEDKGNQDKGKGKK